jgi:hypothetical protein
MKTIYKEIVYNSYCELTLQSINSSLTLGSVWVMARPYSDYITLVRLDHMLTSNY